MPVPTRTIQGKVLLPSGAAVQGGSIVCLLSEDGSVLDGSTSHKATRKMTVAVGTDGTVNFSLIPNDAITPTGTFYAVTGKLPNGDEWKDFWDIPSGATPLDIGAVPAYSPPAAPPGGAVTVLPAASAFWDGRVLRVNPTDGSPSHLAVCLPNGAGGYNWSIYATGGG